MELNISRLRKLLLMLVMVFSFTIIHAQEKVVTGLVTDANDGMGIPGVSVVVKGTTIGTTTDIDGNYTLNVNANATIIYSFVGYRPQEILVGSQPQINVFLSVETENLSEIIVIGYGTIKKEDKTGSVTSISSKDFNKGNITSPQDLLIGKSSGVVITSAGGAPGSGSTIRIRGGSSLNASNNPLIIVDGMPIENSDDNVSGSANALSFINPNDIETFTVLKDASSTAIYGSRASNGVIIITTKTGTKGKPMAISYNANISVSTPVDYIDVYSGDQLRKIASEHIDLFDSSAYDKLGSENTDWQEEIFRTSISHAHNLALSGAYKNLPYRFSIGYTDQKGILKNTDMQRITGSLNLNPTFFKDALKVNLNAKFMSTDNNFGDEGAIGSAISMDPTQPIYDGNTSSDGYYQWVNYGANLGTANPVEQAMAIDNRSEVTRFVGNLKLNYQLPFLSGLQANLNIATDYTESDGHNNRPTTSPSVLISPLGWGQLTNYTAENKNNLLEFYLNYAKDLDKIDSRINATAGYSWQHFEREGTNYTRAVEDDDHSYQESDDSAYATENYLVSFFGRINYSYLNKYLLTSTVRYDGSSRFSDDNRWGLFPSAAVAWKIHEESFLKDVDFLSNLKFRLSWGKTGQQDVGNDYPSQAAYTTSESGYYYYIDGEYIPTLRPNTYDPNIKWEETTTKNIAIDFGFFNNRINGTIDYYMRETTDLLNEVTIPSGSNFSNTLLTNIGNLENKGIEVSLNFIPISKPDMSLNIGFNFTHNKQEVTKLLLTDDPDYIGVTYGDDDGTTQVTRVGEEAYSFFVNKQIYDTKGNPIEGMYEDLAGEGGTISGDDENKYVYHSPTPDYIFGFSARFNYKKFDISTSLRANIGNYVLNDVARQASYDQMQQIGYWRNMPTYLSKTNFVKRQFTSDYFVENASFLKMDNISAGYTFDKFANKKLNARVSFTVQNVFTITNYSGLDPEVGEKDDRFGIDNNFYPRPRTFTLGVSLTF